MRVRIWIAVALGLGVLTIPASASAATRYAAPGETDTTPCTQANPCNIQNAVEDASPGGGDEVILNTGEYTIVGDDPLQVVNGTNVHGALGQPPPRIVSGASTAVSVDNANAFVHHLAIEHSGGGDGLNLANGTVERAFVNQTAGGGGEDACQLTNPQAGTKLRDSVCWGSAASTSGAEVRGVMGTFTGVLRNVTAVGTGFGLEASTSSAAVTVDAKNVIAFGGAIDIAAFAGGLNSATVTMAYSNYDTVLETETGSVTGPNTGTNQGDPPVFVNASTGDFHQAPSSTATIDRGGVFADLGSADIDGESRNQGSAPDIGADEFTVSPPVDGGGDGDTTAPTAQITSGPKDKTKKKTATFTFTGTDARAIASFQCKLDAGAFAPCTSPHTVKVKRGKHHFEVQAIDQAGNLGAPATDDWKVKKKKKQARK
jgi:hypothetical protein